MSLRMYIFLVTCAFAVGVSNADIFGDFFKWDIMSAFTGGDDDDDEPLQREEEDSTPTSCTCTGMKCDCCVDFNISSVIDLGGPGCVNMKYLSKEEGVLLNVSYGDSVLHTQKVTSQNKKGTCMPLLSYFAEICARFADLQEKDDGMTGCLNFEPTVFGEVTTQYPVGCFRMGPNGMFLESYGGNVTDSDDEAEEEEDSTSQKPEEEQSFLEAVNQSAQESLEFFSNLLGFKISGKKRNSTTNATPTSNTEKNRKNKNKKFRSSRSLM